MKPSSFQRWLFEAINLLLVLTFSVPLSALLGLAFGYVSQLTLWVLCVVALGFLAGRLTMRLSAGAAMLGCGLAAAGAGALCGVLLGLFTGGFGAHLLGSIVYVAAAVIGSVYFFFCARKAAYTIYAPMTTVGVLLHLAALLALTALKAPAQLLRICSGAAIVFFLLALYAYNARGLRKSVYTGDKARSAHLPRGIQASSFLLVSSFILLAVLLSWLGPAIPALAGLVGRGLLFLVRGVLSLIGLIDKLAFLVEPLQSGSSGESDSGSFMDAEPREQSELMNHLVGVLAIVAVVILGAALLVMFYKKFLKGLKGVQALLSRLRGMFEPEQEEDYVDETESLFSWKKALESATEGLRGALLKLTDRPQKFDDFQTGRLKIRFVYQSLLKRRMAQEGGAAGRYETPNELQPHLPTEAAGLIEAYNGVRYAGAEPTEAQLSQAQALLKQK